MGKCRKRCGKTEKLKKKIIQNRIGMQPVRILVEKGIVKSQSFANERFYVSKEWRALRYKALIIHGRRCMCCFAIGKELHVDHIKPMSKYPALKLDINNLQILCKDCNLGKSNIFEHDFRKPAEVVTE